MWVSDISVRRRDWGAFKGELSWHISFGGCPLRCPGFGATSPTGVTSCIAYESVLPVYRDTWRTYTSKRLAEIIEPTVPLITFTGGEPLMQPSGELEAVAKFLGSRPLELWTSASLSLPSWVLLPNRYIMVDVKLSSSGEGGSTLLDQLRSLNLDRTTFSFTLKEIEDLLEIEDYIKKIKRLFRAKEDYDFKFVLISLDSEHIETLDLWSLVRRERIQVVDSYTSPSISGVI